MSRKVITVDDSKTMRDMVAFTLRDAGFEVLEAADGLSALTMLGLSRVDCIITDLNMPMMDGIQLIRELRAHAVHRATPILMLTTESDPAKKEAGRQAGATGWLVKPFDPDKLIQVIGKVCQ